MNQLRKQRLTHRSGFECCDLWNQTSELKYLPFIRLLSLTQGCVLFNEWLDAFSETLQLIKVTEMCDWLNVCVCVCERERPTEEQQWDAFSTIIL